jgi:hypothetical protein
LQQSLQIFGFPPVEQTAAIDVAGSFQFFFGALEGFFLEQGLRDRRPQAASFEISERRAKDSVRQAKSFQEARGQPGSQAWRERQGEPGEG